MKIPNTTQKIFIEPDLSEQKTERTFIHEVLHGIWEAQGLNKADNLKGAEEQVVEALSHGIHQVLKDNHFLRK